MKKLILMFLPGAKRLAKYEAEKIQSTVNRSSVGREVVVGRYASLARETTETAAMLSKMLEDGKIDDDERDTIAQLLEPLNEKILALVKGE